MNQYEALLENYLQQSTEKHEIYARQDMRGFARWLDNRAHEATARPKGDGWVENAKSLLERCPFAVQVREGGGPEELLASLVVTFQGMQDRLTQKATGQSSSAVETRAQPYGWVWEWPDGQVRFVRGATCPGDKWIPLYR